jgi:cytochrome b pre-mRNA-processing protein 3
MLSFLSRNRADRDAAERIYAAAVEAARRPFLFRDCGMPDTLQGRFESVTLHLFAILHRLMHEPGDQPVLARLVTESFVAHTDANFREMGVGDAALPKRMTTLYQSFAGRIAAYTRGLKAGDQALAEAITSNVFPDGDTGGHALGLAKYVSAGVAALREAKLAELRGGCLPFPEPPFGRSGTPQR